MWWPFGKRGTRVDAVTEAALLVVLPQELGAFSVNDACIKLWLPEILMTALNALSAAHGMSLPDVQRWLLFEHVYGRPALDRLRAYKREKDAQAASRQKDRWAAGQILMSPKPLRDSERTITTKILGKSDKDFTLWLPSPLKAELVRLAKTETLGLSDYIRKTLVRVLLGESFHHRWQAAIGKLPGEVRQFEKDQSI